MIPSGRVAGKPDALKGEGVGVFVVRDESAGPARMRVGIAGVV